MPHPNQTQNSGPGQDSDPAGDQDPSHDQGLVKKILLKNRIPEADRASANITRYQSGIINKVYGAGRSPGNQYIVKLEDKFEKVLAHQEDITHKLLQAGARVPRILDAGIIEGKHYLLMEKVPGQNIVYGWLKFSTKQKENFIAQIAAELQKFHSIKFDQYAIRIASGPKFQNLKDAVARIIDFNRINQDNLQPDHRKDVQMLEEFYHRRLPILQEETGTAVLVHNDLNLENIFYEGESITGIIDLDWVCQAPKDFELWKIVEVFRAPIYSVEERLEPQYQNYQMTEELQFLKKHYPSLFQTPDLADRVRLYYLEKILDRIEHYQSGQADSRALQIFQEEMQDIFKSDWLDKLLAANNV